MVQQSSSKFAQRDEFIEYFSKQTFSSNSWRTQNKLVLNVQSHLLIKLFDVKLGIMILYSSNFCGRVQYGSGDKVKTDGLRKTFEFYVISLTIVFENTFSKIT